MTFFSIALILFLIMDPLGNVSSYLKLVDGIPAKRQRWILIREMLIALVVMIAFNFIGEWIFDQLHISMTTVHLSSGMILFLVAMQILYPSLTAIRANLPKGEPFIIPLAIPLIAGPSLLATIMLYSHMEESTLVMLAAIVCAWAAACAVLLCSKFFKKLLTNNGLLACEKLMGMVLVLLAIQRFLDGVLLFLQNP